MTNRIGLIAGSGQFPILFARAALEKGMQIYAAAYKDEADPALGQHAQILEWFYVGQINRLIKFFRRHQVTQAVMMGAIHKPRMFTHVRPDTKALALIARMRHTHDDALLREFANVLEKEGIRIRPSTFLLPDLLASAGVWTRRKPSPAEYRDICTGWRIAKEIGRLDIGQCIVLRNGSVLAVEAIDGTDATIRRAGLLAKGEAVVVKVCKPDQDTRFDIPAVGLQTIETMQAANAKTLAIEAGKAVVFDREAMIRQADEHHMAVVALDEADLRTNGFEPNL
jgi:UDP-2,3-diacylglucosamine hydrolase